MGEKLTEREIACLRFLSPLMDATPEMIGRAIMPGGGGSKRGRAIVGSRVADGLWYRGPGMPPLVTRVSKKLGYAITPAGRAALPTPEDPTDG